MPVTVPAAKRTSRTITRRTYHHGDLSSALLDAADALVAEKGPAGFSLREAARKVGVDPAACYRHFRDREEVLRALARRGFTRLAAEFADVAAAHDKKPPESLLRALAHAYVKFATDAPSAFRVTFGPHGLDARDPRLRGDYRDGVGPYERLQRALSTWADSVGVTLDLEAAALMMWSTVHGFSSLISDGALRFEKTARRNSVVDLMITATLAGLISSAR